MQFIIDNALLEQSSTALSTRDGLHWIVGGAGSGKTTICQVLSVRFEIPVYDMDAHIYGAYHSRFRPERHLVNRAWSTASNGLAYLLGMSWDEFDAFHRAALPEYLDLLAEDLAAMDPQAGILIDGGAWHPALLARVVSPSQIVCLARPNVSSADIWTETGERKSMMDAIRQLPNPEEAWRTFLEYDQRITHTVLKECQEHGIPVCSRGQMEPVAAYAERVAQALGWIG